jgi:beta-N-acetylhexosaminidase
MVWLLGDYSAADAPAFAAVTRLVTEQKVGGIVMSLGSPGEVASKLNYLQSRADVPLLVGADLEPGLGRLEGGVFTPSLMTGGSATVLPSTMAIGATGSVEMARRAGQITGVEAVATGVRLVFAPVVDVNNNPANPVINVRSFGEDPEQVARLSAAFVEGVQGAGAGATLKHFPGHGDTDTDSHLALPVVRSDLARLRSVELVPFRRGIDAGATAVMTAHVALPAIGGDSTPATLRPAIMSGLLRDSLGFRGLTVTDALTMQGIGEGYTNDVAVVRALQAGSDILLMPTDVPGAIAAVERAVAGGEIPPARLEAAVRRVLEWKVRTGTVAHPRVSLDSLRQVVGSAAHWAAADSIAAAAVTLLRDSPRLVPLARQSRVTVATYTPELDVTAGRAFAAELQVVFPKARNVRLTPETSPASLAALAASLGPDDRLVVPTHVRTIEGAGRFAVAPAVATWVDSVSRRVPTVVAAHGNPYVLRQFPAVTSYLVTYGRGDALERAAARAITGVIPIGGRSPISLPGFFRRGDGLDRTVSADAGRH